MQQYYTQRRGGYPRSILLPCELEDREDLEELLSQTAGHKVYLETPRRGERMRLIESARLNAREEILRRTTGEQRRSKTLEWLQKALELERFPRRIEAFDISNLGDTGIVAGMTVHVDGKPRRGEYKKFRIRDLEGQDDYASMYQAVYRRLKRYQDGDEHFSPLPDLLLIDGGEVHAATAVKAQEDLGIFVPTFGMVKDDRHRTRALITPGGSGDRHPDQPGGVRPDRQHPGGDPQHRHRVPALPAQGGAALYPGQDRGGGAQAPRRSAQGLRQREGHPGSSAGAAAAGGAEEHRPGRVRLFSSAEQGGEPMRVITGSARGRKLKTPENYDIRPTTDNVKEALFNIIQFDIEGRRVLDLFAGTGQLGIEALSRGAKSCVFVDRDRAAVKIVKENLKTCALEAAVIQADALEFLRRPGQFDLIFVDPPYDAGLYGEVLKTINLVDKLSDGGIIICEARRENPLPSMAAPYRMTKEYTYGKVKLCLYTKEVEV